MVELTLGIRLIIFVLILVIGYFILRHYEIDLVMIVWESISELEWNPTALVLTLLFSALLWAMMWKSPLWLNSTAFGTPSRIFLTIALPIVAYPLSVRALTKQ